MSSFVEVTALVEGQTELKFVKEVLAPHLKRRGVFMSAFLLEKPGQAGGDVKFARAQRDITSRLKQGSKAFVTLMVDFYKIKKDWPGFDEAKKQATHRKKAEVMNAATLKAISEMLPDLWVEKRFIPYLSMHELEALYFSDPATLAAKLGAKVEAIEAVLKERGEPESINDSEQTAPSKRLEGFSTRYKKTTTGIAIAQAIGIQKMRDACPIFNAWLTRLEELATPPAS